MERLGWRLRLAGLKPDVLERMTGIKERRVWEAGTTVVQMRRSSDRHFECHCCLRNEQHSPSLQHHEAASEAC